MDDPKTNGEGVPAVSESAPAPEVTTELLALRSKDLMDELRADGVVTVALTPGGLVVGACAQPDGPTLLVQAMLKACSPVFNAVTRELAAPTRPCPSCRGDGNLLGVVCVTCGGRRTVPRG